MNNKDFILNLNRKEENKLNEHWNKCRRKKYLLKYIKNSKRHIRELEKILKHGQHCDSMKRELALYIKLCKGNLEAHIILKNIRRK